MADGNSTSEPTTPEGDPIAPEGDPGTPESAAASHDLPRPAHLREAIAADWAPAAPMPHPARPDGASYTAKRRAELSGAFPGTLVVLPAGQLQVRANDTDYAFRASSAF